jgi:hypothetical protein
MKKIECLRRLYDLNQSILSEIMSFLKDNDIIEENDVYEYKVSLNKPEFLYKTLESIKKKVQMVSFQWTILPDEFIIISIATEKEYKEFIYGQ